MKRTELLTHINEISNSPLQEVGSVPLILFAGPCQLESLDHSLSLAEEISKICSERAIPFVFKGSFDKANRTSLNSTRGLGLQKSIAIFKEVQEKFDLPTLTDIHLPEQAEQIADAVDIIQIPAFLCRQTDLLIAAGKTGKIINLKKGQFLAPSDMQYAAEKIQSAGSGTIFLCERGTSFGYRDLVVDMRGLRDMRQLGFPVVFDGTHSVQSIGGNSGSSGGSPEHIETLCKAAVAVGIDALFLEVHEEPTRAPSDANSMLELEKLPELLDNLLAIHAVNQK